MNAMLILWDLIRKKNIIMIPNLENGKGTVTGTPWKFESVDISKVWVLGDMDKISDVVQC